MVVLTYGMTSLKLPEGNSCVKRAGVFAANFEKNPQEVPRSSSVVWLERIFHPYEVPIIKQHKIDCQILPVIVFRLNDRKRKRERSHCVPDEAERPEGEHSLPFLGILGVNSSQLPPSPCILKNLQ